MGPLRGVRAPKGGVQVIWLLCALAFVLGGTMTAWLMTVVTLLRLTRSESSQ